MKHISETLKIVSLPRLKTNKTSTETTTTKDTGATDDSKNSN